MNILITDIVLLSFPTKVAVDISNNNKKSKYMY